MTDESRIASDDAAVAGVVRSFTEAEVALREITGAAAEFRSATDSLDAAGVRLDTARSSLSEVAGDLRSLTATLAETSRTLGVAAEPLLQLRPDQVWAALHAIREDDDAIANTLAAGLAEQSQAATKTQATLADIQDRLRLEVERTDKRERRVTYLLYLSGATVVGMIIVIGLLAIGIVTGS